MIIEKLGIKKSNFALLTAQLEREGSIVIHQAEIDKRCRTLSLTEKGKEELDRYLEELNARLGLTDVNLDDALDIILKYLNKLV